MKTTYCPICHLELDGGHERDGSGKCWGHEGFDVTDDELDAPDGAVVDGYERHRSRWEPAVPPAVPGEPRDL